MPAVVFLGVLIGTILCAIWYPWQAAMAVLFIAWILGLFALPLVGQEGLFASAIVWAITLVVFFVLGTKWLPFGKQIEALFSPRSAIVSPLEPPWQDFSWR
jgi:hypothetical protein